MVNVVSQSKELSMDPTKSCIPDQEHRNPTFGRNWLLIVVSLYTAACFLPAWSDHESGATLFGWQCLVSFPFCMMHTAWYSNIFLICGVIAAAAGGARELIIIALISGVLAATDPFPSPSIRLGLGFGSGHYHLPSFLVVRST